MSLTFLVRLQLVTVLALCIPGGQAAALVQGRPTGWLHSDERASVGEALRARGLSPSLLEKQLPPLLRPGVVWRVSKLDGSRTPFPTIQAAVDSASSGDTVLLSAGLFSGPGNREVLVTGKDLTIRGQAGAGRTFVDGEGMARGFHFEGAGVTSATVLSGVSVIRGYDVLEGGGILCDGGATPWIEDVTVAWCSSNIGGGVYYVAPAPTGVGLRRCTLIGNEGNNGGGGIVARILVEQCLVAMNRAEINGGGLYVSASTTVQDSLFLFNRAVDEMGAVSGTGGGMELGFNGCLIRGCSIIGNQAISGGGISLLIDNDSTIASCIVWANSATQSGAQIVHASYQGFTVPKIRFCDVQGGSEGIATVVITGGSLAEPFIIGLLEEDPLFVSGTYELSSASPCIDKGRPAFVASPNQGDFAGQPRESSGRVDIGADEFWDGLILSTVWPARAEALNTLEIEGARPGDLVHVFTGTSKGTTSLAFPACPTLALDISSATLSAVLIADTNGRARLLQYVTSSLAGQSLEIQAVALDLTLTSAACLISNGITAMFR